MITHSSILIILARRIPWTEESGQLYGAWGHKESDTTERLTLSHFFTFMSNEDLFVC